MLEQQSLSAVRRFHLSVCPFGDQQICVDWNCNAFQLASLIKRCEEIAK